MFSASVKPVQLPHQGEMQTGKAILSGWGSTSKSLIPKVPNILQKAVVPILDNAECLKELKSQNTIGKQPELFDTQVCSGSTGKEISACSVSIFFLLRIDCVLFQNLNIVAIRIRMERSWRRAKMLMNLFIFFYFYFRVTLAAHFPKRLEIPTFKLVSCHGV